VRALISETAALGAEKWGHARRRVPFPHSASVANLPGGCANHEDLEHEAAVLVTPFWPRVGKHDKDAIDRRRQQRRDHQPCVIGKNTDVVQVAAFDMREQPGDTWLEYLTADEADLGMAFGLSS